MAAKIASAVITFLINITSGVVILFFMLIAMNGFRGSDAQWGLGAYVILAIIVTLLMGIGAALVVHLLLRKQFAAVVSAIIAVPVFSIFGIGLEVVCSLIGVGVAEFVRVNC